MIDKTPDSEGIISAKNEILTYLREGKRKSQYFSQNWRIKINQNKKEVISFCQRFPLP